MPLFRFTLSAGKDGWPGLGYSEARSRICTDRLRISAVGLRISAVGLRIGAVGLRISAVRLRIVATKLRIHGPAIPSAVQTGSDW